MLYELILQIVALSSLVIAILGFTTFALTYGYQADWRATPAGRAVMYVVLSVDLALGLTLLNGIAPHYPAERLIATLVFVGLAAVAWRLVHTLYRAQHIDPFVPFRWIGRKVKSMFAKKEAR